LRCRSAQGILVARGDDHARALVDEPLGDREPDATTRSGNEGSAAIEAIHRGS
jgi:hypothetical protein